jgi:hypothetical protein
MDRLPDEPTEEPVLMEDRTESGQLVECLREAWTRTQRAQGGQLAHYSMAMRRMFGL